MSTSAGGSGQGSQGSQGSQGNLIKMGLLGAGGFAAYQFLYVPYAAKKAMEAATQAALQANLAKGLTLRDAAADAIAGACAAAATAYKVPPAISGGACKGIGVLAVKGVELAGKGAVIAGKVVGKGAVVVAKGVGKAGAVVGKTAAKGATVVAKTAAKGATVVAKGTAKASVAVAKTTAKTAVAVTYKAPKAIIGGSINKTDKVLSKVASKIVPKAVLKVIPKPVKKVAAVTKKVVKKVLCLGVFCGLDGLEGDALDYFAAVAPQDYTRQLLTALSGADEARPNPMLAHARLGARKRVLPPGTPGHTKRLAHARSVRAAAALGALAEATRPRLKPRRGAQTTNALSGSSFYGRHL